MLRCFAGPSIIALLHTIQDRRQPQVEHHTVERSLWLPHLSQTVLRWKADPKHLTHVLHSQTSKVKGTLALPGATRVRKGRRAPPRAHNTVRTHQNHCELNAYLTGSPIHFLRSYKPHSLLASITGRSSVLSSERWSGDLRVSTSRSITSPQLPPHHSSLCSIHQGINSEPLQISLKHIRCYQPWR